jgi:multidrug efflux pump subunit AcrB
MKKVVAYFAERSLIVNIITVAIILAGILALSASNREAFPKIDFDWLIVTTIYPGATASDIEKHVTISIENKLREVDGIEEVYSGSSESRSVVAIKLDPDIENKDKAINDIKNAIDLITDFPDDAEDPIVIELSSTLTPIIEISVMAKNGVADDEEERDLRKYAKLLEDSVLDLDGVAKIEKRGYRDREMLVEINPFKLKQYKIGVNEIIRALSNKNLNFPGGVIKTKKEDILVRTIGEVETANDIRNVLLKANDLGNYVRIKDVAKVKDSFEEEEITNATNGKKTITLTAIKKESADIITVVNSITEQVEKFNDLYDDKYEAMLSNDLSYFVKRRLKVLINNSVVGLSLVLLTLLITLGWRISSVTALGIPLAFGGTFIWMAYYGVTINLMSMFGLIMVLGMIVDDAIIVAENVYRHLEEGEPLMDAVIYGTSEVITPVAGTIMTTIAAFGPLMFMSGIMGKFMWTLPAVVSVALIASWIESMFILPSHIKDIERGRKKSVAESRKERVTIYERIRHKYITALTYVLNRKYRFAGIITLLFIGTVIFAANNVQALVR